MKIEEAEQLAKNLMQEHHLDSWVLKWTESRTWFGLCSSTNKVINLSRPLTELNELKHVKDTILHEIAHALAPFTEHHGKIWKQIARDIGCEPQRCYSDDVIQPMGKYTATCKKCGKQTQKDKKPRRGRMIACGACCKKFNHGRFAKKYKLKFIRNKKEGGDINDKI